ncbi:ImmA/IrrE family metallo-endopeptidase [Leuconostoc falkenbergense]|uniref:ImmA/IrrE family metallo-endopeptidase n=1 Tax=Leuconostoc falkenbergense TaxID=2766470 RepID=UPI001967ED60|nr:ImmA/IrrE family metallo-endopeptidase [Leuconostoc falkenbergense]QSB51260.1 ImmA/IrrE family metallo-endopeptidase [Leuconostoc falkenbergense]
MIDVISDEVISKLLTIADSHNIIIRDNLNLTTGTPDVCFTYDKGIVMNPNWDIKVNYSFRLSHELSHILYGDHEAQAVYQFSEYGKRGEELLAHKNAIKMLMSIEMPTTVNGFMEYYHVPSWLEKDVDRTFRELAYLE